MFLTTCTAACYFTVLHACGHFCSGMVGRGALPHFTRISAYRCGITAVRGNRSGAVVPPANVACRLLQFPAAFLLFYPGLWYGTPSSHPPTSPPHYLRRTPRRALRAACAHNTAMTHAPLRAYTPLRLPHPFCARTHSRMPQRHRACLCHYFCGRTAGHAYLSEHTVATWRLWRLRGAAPTTRLRHRALHYRHWRCVPGSSPLCRLLRETDARRLHATTTCTTTAATPSTIL